jgi:hypothetical protein
VKNKLLSIAAYFSLMLPMSANAGLIISSGQVVGIDGISIGGTSYILDIVDGTYDGVFGDTVYTSSFASDARDQATSMFLGSSHQNLPDNIQGCNSIAGNCYIMFPFAISTDFYSAEYSKITLSSLPESGTSTDSRARNINHSNVTYARISEATVPTPATLALFSIGLAGLGWSRRKKA